VHLGFGSCARAHQAWNTPRAPDAAGWGIAAFTGRTPGLAEVLADQDGLYTLVTRDADGDRFEVVGSLSAVHPASDHDAWLGYARSPELAVVTLTVTEAGYRRSPSGGLDVDDELVRRDVAALREDLAAPVSTVPARLLAALAARREAALGPVAVVPCDNLPANGAVVARVLRELATVVDPALVAVVDDMASFVTSMVDRITPATTADDRALVESATGVVDAAPVATEPFSEWVLAGDFPAGRPAWDEAGARVVEDVEPFEQRKLWLLNGAHSVLAYGASTRGHLTVAEAIADATCRSWVEDWWDEACRHLTLPDAALESYRAALLHRFRNPRIRHALAQIAGDGSQKVPVRLLPVLRAERAAGRIGAGAALGVAAWVCHLRGLGAPVDDPGAAALVAAAEGTVAEAVARVMEMLDPQLAADVGVVDLVVELVERLSA
jgi:fructuronate reductase